MGSSPLKRDSARECNHRDGTNQKELSLFKGDERNGVYGMERRGSQSSLKRLLDYRTPDGRYLVTRKVHWQAVYRVLVDEGWYDASLGYAGFVDYIRSVAPPGGFRIMPDVETIRHISQTLYSRPFRDWRYDAAYGTKRWAYERMRRVATTLLGLMGEMVNETIRNGYLDEPT
jgi:hypothetical protein